MRERGLDKIQEMYYWPSSYVYTVSCLGVKVKYTRTLPLSHLLQAADIQRKFFERKSKSFKHILYQNIP